VDLRRAIGFGIDMATGMIVAHQVGIVHRDLKPANVLITMMACSRSWTSASPRPARGRHAPDQDRLRHRLAQVHGPEQILGRKVDERADIYAVGVMLYEMMTGVPRTRAAITCR